MLVAGTLAVSLFVPQVVPVAVLPLLAVPVVPWWPTNLDRTAAAASLGGAGAVAVLLVLGVILAGLAVGEGVLLVATEVDGANVSTAAAADFESAPDVRADLLTSVCEVSHNWSRASLETCRLRFWHYEHEAALVAFLARRADSSLVARHEDSYYRVTCQRRVD